ncbi:MAG: hypothetical protein KJI72_00240 [Patescibacteria group bacterium]|nr:hypothetical protein [Patescibacteria group bacterium]
MPQLQDTRKTVNVKLQAIEGGEVSVYTSLLASDIEKFDQVDDASDSKKIVPLVTMLIKDWNLTNDKDEVLPITEENVRKLDIRDVKVILDQLKEITAFLTEGAVGKK